MPLLNVLQNSHPMSRLLYKDFLRLRFQKEYHVSL
nr:MAG TPA: hypothetical protein [Caudoviricetes sp.]